MINLDLPLLAKTFFLFGVSLISTSIIIYIFNNTFRKIGLMDHPEKYPHEWNRAPIPYWMWIILFINFVLLCVTFLDIWYKKLIIILVLGAIISIVSFIDDLDTIDISPFRVPPIIRLLLQIWIWAVIGITSIKIWYMSNIFGWVLNLSSYFLQLWEYRIYIIPLSITILWYALVFNSINWSDSIPWLSSWLVGTSLIVILILTIKLYFNDITELSKENWEFVLMLLSIIIPSVFMFWCFDVQKKFLIGDSGTMFLAFIIATLAIISWWKIATVATVLGMYIIDFFYVILMRIYNKKSLLKWDTTYHLHFRLAKLWFSKSFIRNLVYLLSFMFWISAIFLDKFWKIVVFFIMMIIVFFVTKILSLKK